MLLASIHKNCYLTCAIDTHKTMCLQMWRGASKPWMVAVEDPQVPGRDIGASTREMPTITSAWAEAAQVLRPPADAQVAPGRLALSVVLDVGLAVGRGVGAAGKHAKLQRRAGVDVMQTDRTCM